MNLHNILPLAALCIMGVLAMLLVFFAVPAENKEILIFVSGALSGALTGVAGAKLADRINRVGPIVPEETKE